MGEARRALLAVRFSALFGLYAAAGGVLTLLGWFLDIRRLAAWDNSITQLPNSAVAIVAAGAGLVCWRRGWRRTAAVLGGFAGLIGLATLLEHATAVDLGIDRLLLIRDWGRTGAVAPGRMGIPGSFSLAVIGFSMAARISPRTARWATIGGLLTIGVAALSLIGYLFQADPLYTIPKLTTIALQTATMLLALGVGLLVSDVGRAPMRVLLGDSSASVLLRRTLPGTILLLIGLGWLSLYGHNAGLFDSEFAIAALVFLLTGLLAAVLWRASRAIAAHETELTASRDQLAGIVGSITDSFVTLDRDWRLVFVNDEAASRLGRPRAELIGRSVWDFVQLDRESEAWKQIHRAMDERVPVEYEVHVPPAGGWFANRVYPMSDGGLAVYSADVSDRKQAELMFSMLFEKTALGAVLAKLPGGVFVDVNDAFVQMLGYSREELLGRTSVEIGLNPDRERRARMLDELQVRGVLRDQETTLVTKSGQKRTFLNNIAMIDAGAEKQLLTTFQDITERKAGEDALRASTEALRAADRMKDEFLATLSHELRTPLTSIIGWSQILLNGALDAREQRIALEAIRSSAKAQAQLTEDILDVSRITTGKMRLQLDWVDLAGVVDAAVATIRPAAEAKRVSLQMTIDRNLPLHYVDPERMQQVVWNLLSNAVKFSRAGSPVQLTLHGAPDGTVITVADEGPGIPSAFLPHLFERFRQADSSSSRAHAGLGIGLALSRDLVELHGGRIDVETEEGRGSRFVVRLPPAQAGQAVSANTIVERATASLDGVRVLYVDDREDARTLISRMLQQHGANVEQASSADEALTRLADRRPDVVITDLAMPLRDGYSLLASIRADRRWNDLPILALTAQGRVEDESRAATAGFHSFLRKPIDSQDLAAAVARAAGR